MRCAYGWLRVRSSMRSRVGDAVLRQDAERCARELAAVYLELARFDLGMDRSDGLVKRRFEEEALD